MSKKYLAQKVITQTKDYGVELMRILGCFIVIACHCVVAYQFNGEYHPDNTFIANLWADGVAIFWLVAGFFIFKGADASKKLKNFSVKRLLPALGVGGLLFYLYDWATTDTTFLESLHHTKQEYIDLFAGKNGLLKLKSPFPQSGHFWYVIIYVLVLLAFPALKGFWDWMQENKNREELFLIISFVFLAVNDWMANATFNFWNTSIQALVPSCIFIMWGAILYKNKKRFEKGWLGVLGFIGFFAVNQLRTEVMVRTGEGHYMYWFTTFGLVAAICIYVFCINVGKLLQNNVTGKIVCYISFYTYMIYLVHYGVKDVLSYLGLKDKIYEISPPGTPGTVVGYTLLMMVSTFIASFILVLLLHYSKILIQLILKKLSPKTLK